MRDRRRHERRNEHEDEQLSNEVAAQLEHMPGDPSADDIRSVLAAFRREYATFAQRNANRLNEINDVYRKLVRYIMIAGGIFFLLQLGLGAFGLHLQIQNKNTLTQVQSGRHVSLGVTCAVQSAVAQAGREVIAGSSTPPPAAQEQALEMFGFPPFAKRHQQAENAADAYVLNISNTIDKQIGRKGDGLVSKKTGTINCTRLAQLARIG